MTQDSQGTKKRKNLTDIMIALALGLLIYLSISVGIAQYQQYNESAPATNWVEVTSLTVPNFKPGVNPTIDYVREIKQQVSSSWTAELRYYPPDTENYEVACERTGFSELEPGRAPPANGWTVGSFAGTDCVEELTREGRYRLNIVWKLRPRGLNREIVYPISSNTFYVGEVSVNEQQ